MQSILGWVEFTPESVGFRCTQPNLHFYRCFCRIRNPTMIDIGVGPRSFFFGFDRLFFGRRPS
ncbi:hypothetical protein D1AOALGA4SA_2549 [Olavius algarvensis Delta 1 endosymbiont]|nr:hypothetical protein D1AOALGA4SA_2549 [Olavius algarvensis Delta 1 endosymbiont]